ncbi:MAG: hypothetical protein ACKOC8_10170 [Pirellulales bacterium]
MKVLACIPLLDSPVAPPEAAAPTPASTMGADTPRPCVRRRTQAGRFPLASVAILAVLATLAWSLATWNDARRLHRHRLARMQQTTTGTVAR